MSDLIHYDEDDELPPRRWPWDDLDDEHEQAPTAAEQNPSMLLP